MVDPEQFRLVLGDTRTGVIHSQFLPYTSLKWGQRLNGSGPISVTLRPHSKELSRLDLRMVTTTVRNFIGVAYGDTLLEAGPIWSRKYNPKTRELQLDGLGLWSLFDRRKNLTAAAFADPLTAAGSVLSVQRDHLGSIAAELVRVSTEDVPGGDLPLVLPSQFAGTAHERNYKGYSLGWLGDDLRELTRVLGGPDLRFRPEFDPTGLPKVQWVLEHGVVDLLEQTGPDLFWTAAVEQTPIVEYGVDQDGSGVADTVWGTGAGSEESQLIRASKRSDYVDGGYPRLDGEVSAGDEENPLVVQDKADLEVNNAYRPWESWSLVVRADRNPKLGTYLPGDWATVRTPEFHPILDPNETIRVRILAVDGDHSQNVKLSVGPVQSRG